jgi:hypothetical protein
VLTTSKIALSLALVLGAASTAMAATKHTAHQPAAAKQIAHQPVGASESFGSASGAQLLQEPAYIYYQDRGEDY